MYSVEAKEMEIIAPFISFDRFAGKEEFYNKLIDEQRLKILDLPGNNAIGPKDRAVQLIILDQQGPSTTLYLCNADDL
jgi:hypothetical protein